MNRSEIMLDYIKTWFALDILSNVPYYWIIEGCIGDFCSSVFFIVVKNYKRMIMEHVQ